MTILRIILRLTISLGLLCGVVIASAIMIGRAVPYQEGEMLAFSRLELDTTRTYLIDTNQKLMVRLPGRDHYVAAWILNQRKLLYNPSISNLFPTGQYIFDLSTGVTTSLVLPDGFGGFINPDRFLGGDTVALSDGENIFLWNFLNKQLQQLTNRLPKDFKLMERTLSWSPNGKYSAFSAFNGIYVVDVARQQTHHLTNGLILKDLSFNLPLSWSPDSQYLAYIASEHYDLSHLYTIRVTDGEIEQITEFPERANHFWGILWSPDGKQILVRDDRYALWISDLQNHSKELFNEFDFRSVNWSLDSQGLVLLDFSQMTLLYFDLETRLARPLFDYPLPDWTDLISFAFLPK